MKSSSLLLLLLTLVSSHLARAGELDFTGYAGLEVRGFWQDPRYPGQAGHGDASLILQPELYWQSGDQRASLVLFGRADANDSERSHADLREAWWGWEAGDWDLRAGISKVFWGVAESRHLVDVINQADLVEDPDQEDKLGQPMLNVNLQRDYGRFSLFVLPYFRERTFPGADGRLRTPLPADTGGALFESPDEERHVDYALRYSHYFGDVDIGLHLFDGTSREPGFVPAASGDRLLPVYEQMTQLGLDLQYTRDAWLWKLEALARRAASDDFLAAVGGFEYTFYGVRDSAVDVGILLEYQHDGRNDAAPFTLADNDLFAGTRFAVNDAADSSLLAGAGIDVETGELFLNVEAERRFGDNLSASLRLRAFSGSAPGEALYAFERDDYLQLRLSWYY